MKKSILFAIIAMIASLSFGQQCLGLRIFD